MVALSTLGDEVRLICSATALRSPGARRDCRPSPDQLPHLSNRVLPAEDAPTVFTFHVLGVFHAEKL